MNLQKKIDNLSNFYELISQHPNCMFINQVFLKRTKFFPQKIYFNTLLRLSVTLFMTVVLFSLIKIHQSLLSYLTKYQESKYLTNEFI